MSKSKRYKAGDREEYTMEDMVNRIIYWWIRYEGTRTEDGKDFSKNDLIELIHRLKLLHDEPEKFIWNHPDMEHIGFCSNCGDYLEREDEDLNGLCTFCYHELNDATHTN